MRASTGEMGSAMQPLAMLIDTTSYARNAAGYYSTNIEAAEKFLRGQPITEDNTCPEDY